MTNHFYISFYTLPIFLLLSFSLQSQQKQFQDSLDTPFRKGRWLTGLSGSISTNTTRAKANDQKSITNEFGLNFSTGRFIKDRWLLGGKLNTNRASSSGSIDRTTESLYVGPFVSYYLSPNNRGSLFTSLSSGYVRYRDETKVNAIQAQVEQQSEGGGFGTLIGLGYSYVIHDKIAFDIGFNLNLFWIGLDQEEQSSIPTTSQNLTISNTAFTFGFNVILDDFFF